MIIGSQQLMHLLLKETYSEIRQALTDICEREIKKPLVKIGDKFVTYETTFITVSFVHILKRIL